MSAKWNHSTSSSYTLFPVILPVPAEVADYEPRDRVVFLSRHARQALRQSAHRSGIEMVGPEKDEKGVPLPSGGHYWSISHKKRYVCGVVAPQPIGIDIERIRDFSKGVFRKTASGKEWALAEMETASLMTFFRFWTAKEAVLKATGIGIRDLLKCRVCQIIDDRHLKLQYAGKDWLVEHYFYEDHVASIVKSSFRIKWTVS